MDDDPFTRAFDLRPLGPGRFEGHHVAPGEPVVFGGQLLGQAIVAAARTWPDKQVLSVHAVFGRGVRGDEPVRLTANVVNNSRTFATVRVTTTQGERACVSAQLLLHVPDEDLIRWAAPAPAVLPPAELTAARSATPWWDHRIVDGVDLGAPDSTGPPQLQVWSRFPGATGGQAEHQARVAYATDGFLIGTAMRPHPGLDQSQAHVTVSTTVLAHAITFHEPVDASRWHLLDQRSDVTGRGRAYGRGAVYDERGSLVASFVQDSMIRRYRPGTAPQPGERAPY